MTLDNVRDALKLRLRQSGNIATANTLFADPEDYYDLINDALIPVAQETRTPEVRWNLPSGWPVQTPPVREIKMPESCIQILRVYANGQRIEPTDPPLLEGQQARTFDATWTVFQGDTINPLTQVGQLPVAVSTINATNVQYYVREQNVIVLGLTVPQITAIPIEVHGVSLHRFNNGNQLLPYGEKWKNYIVKLVWVEMLDIMNLDSTRMQARAEMEVRKTRKDRHMVQSDKGVVLQPLPYRSRWRSWNRVPGNRLGYNERPWGWGA
jgi:hypothetical protein